MLKKIIAITLNDGRPWNNFRPWNKSKFALNFIHKFTIQFTTLKNYCDHFKIIPGSVFWSHLCVWQKRWHSKRRERKGKTNRTEFVAVLRGRCGKSVAETNHWAETLKTYSHLHQKESCLVSINFHEHLPFVLLLGGGIEFSWNIVPSSAMDKFMSGCFAFNNGQKCQISFPNTLIEFLILRMSLPDPFIPKMSVKTLLIVCQTILMM